MATVRLLAMVGVLAMLSGAAHGQAPFSSGGFEPPTPDSPYHHVWVTLTKDLLAPGEVSAMEVDGRRVDGKFCSYVRFFTAEGNGAKVEIIKGRVDGAKDLKVSAPCLWTNGSRHTVRLTLKLDAGGEKVFAQELSAGDKGGYWDAAWPYSASLVLQETAGIARKGEPVHVSLGFFADDIKNATEEIRVLSYEPSAPGADAKGYVLAPSQIISSQEWRDEKILSTEERDAETKELVHRYDATTSVELVFLADVPALGQKVYQVLYGNPEAKAIPFDSDLKVEPGKDLAATVSNKQYRFDLSANSGAVETITVLGDGEPVLLEHKLETNGAVHWNPDCYTPPIPWVHVSDWENPEYEKITGPLMHRTRCYAMLPFMDSAAANVSYSFYAGQPYVLMSSLMEIKKDIFVQALRNSEIVFNHAVLDEFVWLDPLGKVQTFPIDGSREHPIHALEIPADTPWMAFFSRKHKVGFASITLSYENTNLYGNLPSEAQPYIYVQNGPWIYWSRPIVYPFGGQNITRLMPVRKGSLYLEENAWMPFRLKDGDNPFQDVQDLAKRLKNPLRVREWMDMDARTPDKWVMPILTMPFDEGVAGAVSAHKAKEE